MIDVNRLKEIIDYLKTEPEVEYTPYPQYDSRVQELLTALDTDDDYMSDYEEIQTKDISKMSLQDLKTMYTFIARGERFCDGHIALYIKDGTLLRLAQRHLDLISK